MIQALITVSPMLVCMFWAVMLLVDLLLHGNRAAHGALLLWAVVSTLLYVGHCAFFNREYGWLPFFDSLYVACNVAVFPLYLRYIARLAEGRVPVAMNVLVLAPPVVLGTVVGVLYALMTPAETAHFIDVYLYHSRFDGLSALGRVQALAHHAGRVWFALGVVATVWMGIRKIAAYHRLVDSIYADTDDKRLRGITTILLLLVLTSVASFVANAIGRHAFAGQPLLLAIPFTVFCGLLFAIGYCGYHQQFSFADIDVEEPPVASARPVAVEPVAQPEREARGVGSFTIAQVQQAMVEECLFLQPNLKVDDVARHIGTNRRYVQQLLNAEMGMSFSEYTNRLRTDLAEQLIAEQPDLPMDEVIRRSGYGAASTFYRNFKKYKGYMPRA